VQIAMSERRTSGVTLDASLQLGELVMEIEANPPAIHSSIGPSPAFFRMADVLRITALSRATLYRRIAGGKFPPPVHLGGRACGWPRASLQRWIEDPDGYVEETAKPQQGIELRDIRGATRRTGRAG
jgi:prophage regulatory protein